MNLNEYLSAAVDAARAAGLMMKGKAGRMTFREKGWADLVTETDEACQREIARILLDRFPETWIVGEEAIPGLRYLKENQCGSLAPADKPLTWLVDPIDGTTNFVHGVPMFGPSIGLAKGNDLLCGVFFNPSADELFTAVKGEGAFLNGEPIGVSGVTKMEYALASVSFPTQTSFDSPDYLAFQGRSARARRYGALSTALNWPGGAGWISSRVKPRTPGIPPLDHPGSGSGGIVITRRGRSTWRVPALLPPPLRNSIGITAGDFTAGVTVRAERTELSRNGEFCPLPEIHGNRPKSGSVPCRQRVGDDGRGRTATSVSTTAR